MLWMHRVNVQGSLIYIFCRFKNESKVNQKDKRALNLQMLVTRGYVQIEDWTLTRIFFNAGLYSIPFLEFC
jgi:hypothetical protein